MIPEHERYVIRGGKEGYGRLLVLARKCWPDTFALFQRAGVTAGMRCLDLGCGGGAVTLEMARMVAPGGNVVGIDMDEVKLELARQAAAKRHLANVEFRKMNVNDWNELGAYDAIYSRFLLQHLSRPIELLRRMWAGVRPGGLLMVEDADFEGWCCDPPNDAFDFFVRSYNEVVRRNGGDPTLGRRLHRYFLEAGIPDSHLAVVQSVSVEGEAKTLPWSTLKFSSEAIVAAHLASPAELSVALATLEKFTNDPTTLVSGPRNFQVWSRRKST
ncbi:MAG: class I SAM-dependent methyltransferase [Thermoplasmata archaeon]|nr:class I SAM-dependent methyltransferase [Thermoplasmata archaeon]